MFAENSMTDCMHNKTKAADTLKVRWKLENSRQLLQKQTFRVNLRHVS